MGVLLSGAVAPQERKIGLGSSAAGPFVKWAGGKSKLLGELARRAPGSFRRYFEPFVGGGALFFHLGPAAAALSDTNGALVACYEAVRDDVEAVIEGLRAHRDRHVESYYYAVREDWNAVAPTTPAARAAAFIYLNKTCYNGLWRVNSRGGFNVPAGRYEKPGIVDEARLRAASRTLSAVRLKVASFEWVLDEAGAGDFVYLDPPYHPRSETADFTSYTAEGFGPADQERVAEVFGELAARGCSVLASNSDTMFTRRLYRRWTVERVQCRRSVNSRGDRRGVVAELLVRSW